MEGKLERSGEDFAVRLSAGEVRALGLREGQTVEVTAKATLSATTEAGSAESGRRYVNGIPIYTMAEMADEMRRLGPAFDPPTIDWGPDRGSEIIDDDDPR